MAARPRSGRFGGGLVACAAFLAVCSNAAATLPGVERALAQGVLDAEVVDALATADRVRVMAFLGPAASAPAERADAVVARVEGAGFEAVRRFRGVAALAALVDADGLRRLANDPAVARVSLDVRVHAQLSESVPLVRLDRLQQWNITGAGTSVAIVDTGIDLDHPDVADAIAGERCFCSDALPGPFGCCHDGSDDQSTPGAGQDDNGHGTRVASIVTSAAVAAPLGGAPDAQVVAVKVLDAAGSGFISDVVRAIDWIADTRPDVRVVNLSLGGGLYTGDCDDFDASTLAVSQAVDRLEAAGALLVAGAGNNSSGTAMILPACIAKAVSVGAVWDAALGSQSWFGCTDPATQPDQVACWSNSSETTDVFAPGALIRSSVLNGASSERAGTSYATPVVAACATALVQALPGTSPAQLTAALRVSPKQVVDVTSGRIFPRLDCVAALRALAPGLPSLPAETPGLATLALLLAIVAVRRLARRAAGAAGSPTTR
jgi:subtilisin family serine protease